MSQRQVKLTPQQSALTQAGVATVQQATQASMSALSRIASYNKEMRVQTNKVMENAQKNRSEYVKLYTDQIKDANAIMKESMTKHIGTVADDLYKLEVAANNPRLSGEEKKEAQGKYNAAVTASRQDLDAQAALAVSVTNNSQVISKHVKANEMNSSVGQITRSAMNQYKNEITLSSVMSSGNLTDIEYDRSGDKTVIKYKYMDENNVEQTGTTDYDAEYKAFKQTGETLESRTIGEDDSLMNVYVNTDDKYVKSWYAPGGVLSSPPKVKQEWDGATNTMKIVKYEDPIDAKANLLNNPEARKWLENQTNRTDFDKQFTQLANAGYITDDMFKDGDFQTFGSAPTKAHLQGLNKELLALTEKYDNSPAGLSQQEKADIAADPEYKKLQERYGDLIAVGSGDMEISEDEYNRTRKNLIEACVEAQASFIGDMKSKDTLTVLGEQEKERVGRTSTGAYTANAKTHAANSIGGFTNVKKNFSNHTFNSNTPISTQIAAQIRTKNPNILTKSNKSVKNPNHIFSGEELKNYNAQGQPKKAGEESLFDLMQSAGGNPSASVIYNFPNLNKGDVTGYTSLINTGDFSVDNNGQLNPEAERNIMYMYGLNDNDQYLLGNSEGRKNMTGYNLPTL
tara:strand:- start:10167 stop:12047 length:1881 start_codon:yes stop_codon:yes gene_type:complete